MTFVKRIQKPDRSPATCAMTGSTTSTPPVVAVTRPLTGALLTMAALVITTRVAMLLASRRLGTTRHHR